MQYTQEHLRLDGDSWRDKLAFPNTAGIFNRDAAITAVKHAGSFFERPDPLLNADLCDLRAPIMAQIEAEIARAARSTFVHSADSMLRSRPINLSRIAVKGLNFRGAHHAEEEGPRQDFGIVVPREHCLVGALADGASAGAFSHIGAGILACRAVDLVTALLERRERTILDPCNPAFLWTLTAELNNEVARLCAESGVDYRVAASDIFLATLHLVIVTERSVTHLGLCDGYLRDGNDPRWRPTSHFAERPLITRMRPDVDTAPPLVATPHAAARMYEELRRRSEEVQLPPTEEDLETLRLRAIIEETFAFKILSHSSAEDAFRTPIQLATDGIQYTFKRNGCCAFPLDEVFTRLDSKEIETAMTLWNLAAERKPSLNDHSTHCAPGYVRDLLAVPESEVGRELLARIFTTKIRQWLPQRTLRTNEDTVRDIGLILTRAAGNESLRAVLSTTMAPIARELLDSFLATRGIVAAPRGAKLRQLYDDLSIVSLSLRPAEEGGAA